MLLVDCLGDLMGCVCVWGGVVLLAIGAGLCGVIGFLIGVDSVVRGRPLSEDREAEPF